jgi:hypothetical protein
VLALNFFLKLKPVLKKYSMVIKSSAFSMKNTGEFTMSTGGIKH